MSFDIFAPPPSSSPSASSSFPLPLAPPRREGSRNEYLAWFDGACEPVNPGGTASFGVIVKGKNGTVLLREHGVVGKGKAMSNNLAEYAGVLHILKYLGSRPPGRVTIHGNSNLANQLNGRWRIKRCLITPNWARDLGALCEPLLVVSHNEGRAIWR